MSVESELIVSVSGIRGVVGRSLTPEVVLAFASALGSGQDGGRMVVSRDGRPSGDFLRHAVLAGLASCGCEAIELGVVSTPTCGLAVRKLQASGGVQITASHNPAEWNGLKLFGADGRVLSAAEGKKIKQRFELRDFRRAGWQQIVSIKQCNDAMAWHANRVLELVQPESIRGRKFTIVLDANGGAGGPLGRQLLDVCDCRVVGKGCDADGNFLHEPEPIAANLTSICPLIAESQADVGFVLDPDADRLAVIDETGRYIGEELTLALAAEFRLCQERGPVVVNMSTSRVIEDVARRHGCTFLRSAVGEANVADKMISVQAVIGGEGNGGVIDPRVGYVRDPFIGMAMILNLMATTGQRLSELVAALPEYTIVKDKYTVAREGLPALYAALENRWPDAAADHQDGLRLDWPDRWVHVRPSNTEPIVRVISEAPKAADAKALCRQVGELLKKS